MVSNNSMSKMLEKFIGKKNIHKIAKFNTSVNAIDNYLLHLCMLIQSTIIIILFLLKILNYNQQSIKMIFAKI